MVEKAFARLARAVARHPRSILLVGVLLALLGSVLASFRLELKADQNDLVGADLEYNQLYLRFLEEFGDLEFLYVVVPTGENPKRAIDTVDAIAKELEPLMRAGPRGEEPLVQEVFYRIAPETLRYGVPFLKLEKLQEIAASVEQRSA
ncbi:MAG TPA: hypothetical protein VK116_06395, partial [Planctomycetota bacterium]|nr:hypothetical protein [Planctomycetota bacterium]